MGVPWGEEGGDVAVVAGEGLAVVIPVDRHREGVAEEGAEEAVVSGVHELGMMGGGMGSGSEGADRVGTKARRSSTTSIPARGPTSGMASGPR